METGIKNENSFTSKYAWLLVFLVAAILILVRAAFFKDGWLTEDSSAYLSLAKNLLNGDGFYMEQFPEIYQPAITWPVLYPLLIVIVSFITTTSVFWSSKIVNILCMGLVLWLLSKKYGNKTYLFALLYLTSGYLRILSYTWSENIFILGLVMLALCSNNLLTRHKTTDLAYLFLSITVLFYARWIGAFSIGLAGLYALYFLIYLKDMKRFLEITVVCILAFAMMFTQLYFNYQIVGLATGTTRIYNQLGVLDTVLMIMGGFYNELNLLVKGGGMASVIIFIFFIAGTWLYFRKNRKILPSKPGFKAFSLEYSFLIVGLTYIAAIVVMRIVYEFDPLNYRLLGPGTLLVYFSLLGFIIKSDKISTVKLSRYVLAVCFLSLSIETAYYIFRSDRTSMTYSETMARVEESYSVVPENAYVLCSDINIRYIRNDLNLVDPSIYASWDEMIAAFPKDKPLFIDTSTLGDDASRIIFNQLGSNRILTDEVVSGLPKDQLVRLN